MPWTETCRMNERLRFVMTLESGLYSVQRRGPRLQRGSFDSLADGPVVRT